MKKTDKKKTLGQIFTPKKIVNVMLDELNFNSIRVFTAKIMEPAFGKGIFLLEIIKRIIREGRKLNYTNKQIERVIENNIYGIELDTDLFNQTLSDIKNLLKDNDLNSNLNLNLYNKDTIRVWDQFKDKFDIVVGNPPYVRIQNLDLETRTILKEFKFSRGLQDLYICFIEMGYKMLNSNGKLVFITPTTWFHTKFAEKFRNFLQISKNLKTLILLDSEYNPFKQAVETCIFTLQKNINTDTTIYSLREIGLTLKGNIRLEEVKFDNIFVFKANKRILEIMRRGYKKKRFRVTNGIQTLKNEFYIRKEPIGDTFFFKCLKGSTGKYSWVFLPYDESGKLIDLEVIKEKNPEMFQILLENKESLSNRSLDYRQKWWSFGRALSIKPTFIEKYSINNLFIDQKSIKLVALEKNIALDSGYYILTKVDFKKVEELIYSKTFIEYAKTFGNLKNGGFYTLTTRQIELFLNTFYELVYN